MAIPTGSDLATFLLGRGLTVSDDDGTLDSIMAAVRIQWDRDTQWFPFVYSGSTSTRYYTGSGGPILFLNAGIISNAGLVVTESSSARTLDSHFYLTPPEAGTQGMPWTRLQFGYDLSDIFNAIAVTARWGYCETLPEDVRRAWLSKGAAEWMRDYSNDAVGFNGTAGRVKQGPIEIELGGGSGGGSGIYGGSVQSQLGAMYDRAVMRYAAPWTVAP